MRLRVGSVKGRRAGKGEGKDEGVNKQTRHRCCRGGHEVVEKKTKKQDK